MRNRPYKTQAIVFPSPNEHYPTYIKVEDEVFTASVVDSAKAESDIKAMYLTKTFRLNQDTTEIFLSDGRTYIHPRPINHNTMVFSLSDRKFISIYVFNEMIESIPMEGKFDE